MKKHKKILVVLLIFCTMFLICSCGSNRLVGNWISDGGEGPGYPVQMTLKKDGTGIADGYSVSWHSNDEELVLSISILGTLSYTYRFEGSKLYLDGYGYTKNR